MAKEKSFAQRLKAWRQEKDLLQKQAADILSVPLDTYRSWENSQRVPAKDYPPTLATLEQRIAAYKP